MLCQTRKNFPGTELSTSGGRSLSLGIEATSFNERCFCAKEYGSTLKTASTSSDIDGGPSFDCDPYPRSSIGEKTEEKRHRV